MPNQRKSTKKKVNVWLTDEEKAALEKKAASKGMTLTDYLKWIASLPLIALLLAHLWRVGVSEKAFDSREAIRSGRSALAWLKAWM